MAIIPGENKEVSFVDPQEQRQKKLIYILMALFLATGVVLYFGLSDDNSSVEMTPGGTAMNNQPETSAIDSLENIDLTIPVLKSEKFQSLVSPGKLPIVVNENEKGRTNPFEPF